MTTYTKENPLKLGSSTKTVEMYQEDYCEAFLHGKEIGYCESAVGIYDEARASFERPTRGLKDPDAWFDGYKSGRSVYLSNHNA